MATAKVEWEHSNDNDNNSSIRIIIMIMTAIGMIITTEVIAGW